MAMIRNILKLMVKMMIMVPKIVMITKQLIIIMIMMIKTK